MRSTLKEKKIHFLLDVTFNLIYSVCFFYLLGVTFSFLLDLLGLVLRAVFFYKIIKITGREFSKTEEETQRANTLLYFLQLNVTELTLMLSIYLAHCLSLERCFHSPCHTEKEISKVLQTTCGTTVDPKFRNVYLSSYLWC